MSMKYPRITGWALVLCLVLFYPGDIPTAWILESWRYHVVPCFSCTPVGQRYRGRHPEIAGSAQKPISSATSGHYPRLSFCTFRAVSPSATRSEWQGA